GEIAGEYLRKGSQVYVEGSIRYDKYTGQDGVEKYSTDIIADEMQMLGGRGDGGGGAPRAEGGFPRSGGQGGGERPQRNAPAQRREPSAAAPAKPANYDDVPFDDDI